MSQVRESIGTMLNQFVAGDKEAAAEMMNSILVDKVSAALENMKVDVANQMFNTVEEGVELEEALFNDISGNYGEHHFDNHGAAKKHINGVHKKLTKAGYHPVSTSMNAGEYHSIQKSKENLHSHLKSDDDHFHVRYQKPGHNTTLTLAKRGGKVTLGKTSKEHKLPLPEGVDLEEEVEELDEKFSKLQRLARKLIPGEGKRQASERAKDYAYSSHMDNAYAKYHGDEDAARDARIARKASNKLNKIAGNE